jgi:hypothetical protein
MKVVDSVTLASSRQTRFSRHRHLTSRVHCVPAIGIRVAALCSHAYSTTERQATVSPHSRHLAHRRARRNDPLPDELRGHQPVWRKGPDQGTVESRNVGATRGRTSGRPTASRRGDGLAGRSRWARVPLQQWDQAPHAPHPSRGCRQGIGTAEARSGFPKSASGNLAHREGLSCSSPCLPTLDRELYGHRRRRWRLLVVESRRTPLSGWAADALHPKLERPAASA